MPNELFTFCTYCKGILTEEEEILINCHLSCKMDIMAFHIDQNYDLGNLEYKEAKLIEDLLDFALENSPEPTKFLNFATFNKKISSISIDIRYIWDLSIDHIDMIMNVLQQLDNLCKIKLSGFTEKFPFCDIVELKKYTQFQLDLSNNALTTVPKAIKFQSNLIYLNLSINNLKEFNIHNRPELNDVVSLNMASNKLNRFHIPEGYLTKLRYLQLKDNNLQSFNDQIGENSKLYNVDLSNNNLKSINVNSRSIERLIVSHNKIESIFITKTENKLRYFDCSHNKLRYLPENFHNLIHLVNADFSFNQLTSLTYFPESITFLNLANNKLRTINHQYLSNLKELRYLNISNNQIHYLPEAIFKLPKLKQIKIGGNPIAKNKMLRNNQCVLLTI